MSKLIDEFTPQEWVATLFLAEATSPLGITRNDWATNMTERRIAFRELDDERRNYYMLLAQGAMQFALAGLRIEAIPISEGGEA